MVIPSYTPLIKQEDGFKLFASVYQQPVECHKSLFFQNNFKSKFVHFKYLVISGQSDISPKSGIVLYALISYLDLDFGKNLIATYTTLYFERNNFKKTPLVLGCCTENTDTIMDYFCVSNVAPAVIRKQKNKCSSLLYK